MKACRSIGTWKKIVWSFEDRLEKKFEKTSQKSPPTSTKHCRKCLRVVAVTYLQSGLGLSCCRCCQQRSVPHSSRRPRPCVSRAASTSPHWAAPHAWRRWGAPHPSARRCEGGDRLGQPRTLRCSWVWVQSRALLPLRCHGCCCLLVPWRSGAQAPVLPTNLIHLKTDMCNMHVREYQIRSKTS